MQAKGGCCGYKEILKNQTSPNPWVCWMACNNFLLRDSLEVYWGRSRRLKQVWATGKWFSSTFIGWMNSWKCTTGPVYPFINQYTMSTSAMFSYLNNVSILSMRRECFQNILKWIWTIEINYLARWYNHLKFCVTYSIIIC